MKVITEKGGLKAKAVNDKVVISHGIAQKTELSKKSSGKLEKQQVRTVGGTEKATKPDVPNGAPFVVQKRADFAKAKYAQTESLKAALAAPNNEILNENPDLKRQFIAAKKEYEQKLATDKSRQPCSQSKPSTQQNKKNPKH